MIAANELRIGNLVTDAFYDYFKTIIEVKSLNKDGINLEIQDDGNYPECASIWIEPLYLFDVLHGIPLTEEWLLKFGFESNPYQDRYENKAIHVECNKLKGYTELWIERMPHIKYVHQLQNLYFALTGEELTVKL